LRSSQREAYGPGLSAFIDAGRALSGMEYQRLLLRRRAFTGLVQRALEPVDAMHVPAQPFAAPTVARMARLGQVPAVLTPGFLTSRISSIYLGSATCLASGAHAERPSNAVPI
jgi:amidase